MVQHRAKAGRAVALSILLSFCSAVFAQQLVPQQRPGVYQEEIVRISTELIQVNVTVLDKQGRFVADLRPEQFELLVDGKPQTISFFEQLKAGSEQEARSVRLGADQTPTAEKVPQVSSSTSNLGRSISLFVDDLHLSQGSMKRTRDLLLNYVDNMMGPNDQAVIATPSGQLGFLQQLTGDRGVLHMVIERLTYRPSRVADTTISPAMNEYQAVAIENGDREALSYFVDKQCDEFKRMGRGTCAVDTGMANNAVFDDAIARSGRGGTTSGTSPGPVATDPGQTGRGRPGGANANTLRPEAYRLVKSRARVIAQQAAQVALSTLASLESLIRTASPLSERKLVVFISDGFFINFLRSTNAYDLRRVADAALRSGTVIYTIDARGLVTGSPDAATKDGFDPQGRFGRLAMSEVTAAQDPLHALAADTGGRAWINSNALEPGIVQAINETSNYYLLAWRPQTAAQVKEEFRRLKVTVKDRPDLTVHVNGGFFPENAFKSNNAASGVGSVEDQLLAAIRAPYPTRGFPISLSAGYLERPQDGLVLAASAQIEREPLSPSPGANTADVAFDVIGVAIDLNGMIVSSLKQQVTIPAGQYSRGDSTVVTLQFPKLAPGLHQVRIAARESKTGRIGSVTQWIEIPKMAPNILTLSSVFLSEGGVVKSMIKPDRRFARTSKIRFQTYVYNAARPTQSPKVVLQMELQRDGQTIIQTPASPVATDGATDLARIPIVGEFPLKDLLPGSYELKLTVTDASTNTNASRKAAFVIY